MQKLEEIVKYGIAGIVAFLVFVFLFNSCQHAGESQFTNDLEKFNKSQQR